MDIDAALSEDNTVQVAELLEPAKNHSFELGLKLNLPLSEVEAIHQDYSSQHNRFIRIIIKFLQNAEPAATWRVILDALRSPLLRLNGRVEDRARRPLVQQYPLVSELRINGYFYLLLVSYRKGQKATSPTIQSFEPGYT